MSNQSAFYHEDLAVLFKSTFFQSYNTLLIKGDDEPIYLPADNRCDHHRIVFAHGFFQSALHEISHWCLAGKERRLLEDFGYWYLPDGRNAEQQATFEAAEIKPQAIEWAFTVACGKPFDVSVDNLNGEAEPDRLAFKAKVFEQVKRYLADGFPERVEQFIEVLANFYQIEYPLTCSHFNVEELQEHNCCV